MGVAIDSIGLTLTAGTAATSAYSAMSTFTGDSLTVRNFAVADYARLEQIQIDMSTANFLRIKSPMLHDDVQGIRLKPGTLPTQYILPEEIAQNLIAQDTLTAEIDDQTANAVYTAVLSIYYSNLLGQSARLYNPGDILSNIRNIKPMRVDATIAANVWTDTVITTTEDLLHANTDYAVLGIVTDAACCALGVRGQETGNLRITLPGVAGSLDTADAFIELSQRFNTPHIPVFNSANKNSYYLTGTARTSTAVKAQLILGELRTNLA